MKLVQSKTRHKQPLFTRDFLIVVSFMFSSLFPFGGKKVCWNHSDRSTRPSVQPETANVSLIRGFFLRFSKSLPRKNQTSRQIHNRFLLDTEISRIGIEKKSILSKSLQNEVAKDFSKKEVSFSNLLESDVPDKLINELKT